MSHERKFYLQVLDKARPASWVTIGSEADRTLVGYVAEALRSDTRFRHLDFRRISHSALQECVGRPGIREANRDADDTRLFQSVQRRVDELVKAYVAERDGAAGLYLYDVPKDIKEAARELSAAEGIPIYAWVTEAMRQRLSNGT